MGHIFVSYSRRDQEIVDRFVGMMESAGMSVWIDRQKIQAGRLWRTQIVQAIDTCDGFVLMLSTNSAASDNVRREIDLALDSGRNIFIMLLEQVKLTADMRYQLIGLQHIDVKLLGLSKAVKQLIETLREEIVPVQDQPVRQAELVIQGVDLGAFDSKKQEQLLGFVSALVNTPTSQLHIANLTSGSLHVYVDMPSKAAYDLKTLALNRDSRLKKFGIKSLRLAGDKKYVNIALGILTGTATIGFLNSLWMSIPALFPSVLGVVAGKILVITSVIVVATAAGISASKAVIPILNASPTPTSTTTPTNTPTFTPTITATYTITPTSTFTPTVTPTYTLTPTLTLTNTPTPTPFGGGGQKIAFVQNHEIWTMNIDGSGKTRLTFFTGYLDSLADGPDWSPDGSKIVFISYRDNPNGEIYVMDADGGRQTRLTFDDFEAFDPVWSPNGQYIAFGASTTDGSDIYIMLADGSNINRLTFNYGVDSNPNWSPDSNQIIFDGIDGIYVINVDGSDQRLLTNGRGDDFLPSWSPDGRHIAFVSQRDGPSNEIYIMNPDGSGQTRLTSDQLTDLSPDWSPDSTIIVYTTRINGKDDIYVMRIDGTSVRRLTNNENGSDPIWQP